MTSPDTLKALAAEFNRYFTSLNGVDVGERVSVPRDEWRALFAIIESLASADEGVPVVAWLFTDQRCRAPDDCEDFERVVMREDVGVLELERFQKAGRAARLVLQRDHLAALSAQSTAAGEMAVALRDLHDVMQESMGSGGWVPSPLHSSFTQAMINAQSALAAHEAKHGGKG